jgi:hypothetical protein
MEPKIVDLHTMETLGRLIKSGFPVEKLEVSLDDTHFAIYFDESVTNKASQVKAVHNFVKGYIDQHGDPKEEYQFSFYRDRELIDIVHFNYPNGSYQITMELFGKSQNLRVQDVLGATGDYTIFNEDFERVGGISPVSRPPTNPDGTLVDPEDMDGFYGEPYPDFTNESIWEVYPEELKPYLPEILSKVLEQINSNTESLEVNVDDPADVSFWAEQFEISETDLRKAVFAAGKSIDDITAYLQK